mgnify:CR=1 FL=1
MNNLHRELAPISDAAWADLEEETTRTLKRYLAGRRVVDVHGPGGVGLSAVGTGHLKTIGAPDDGVLARQREVMALVELRVPFELDRQQIDDVERETAFEERGPEELVGVPPFAEPGNEHDARPRHAVRREPASPVDRGPVGARDRVSPRCVRRHEVSPGLSGCRRDASVVNAFTCAVNELAAVPCRSK